MNTRFLHGEIPPLTGTPGSQVASGTGETLTLLDRTWELKHLSTTLVGINRTIRK